MPDCGHLNELEFRLGETSLQNLLERIEADSSIPAAKRGQWCCSLRRIGAFLDRHLAQLPARLSALRHGIAGLHHKTLGVEKKTLQNHKSNLRAAVCYGRDQGPVDLRGALSPEWSLLMAVATSTRHRRGLSSLARHCSTANIAPDDVGDATIEEFLVRRRETGFVKTPKALHKQVTRIWNEAVDEYSQWPRQRLTVPDFRPPAHSLPWERFPAGFVEDVDRYLGWLGGRTVDDEGPERPCKPSTLKNRRQRIHLAASAAVRSGVPVETLQSLAELTAPSTVKVILEGYLAKKGGEVTVFIADLAGLLVSIAEVWCKLPGVELAQLKRFRQRLDRHRRKGLTEKNMAVIR